MGQFSKNVGATIGNVSWLQLIDSGPNQKSYLKRVNGDRLVLFFVNIFFF